MSKTGTAPIGYVLTGNGSGLTPSFQPFAGEDLHVSRYIVSKVASSGGNYTTIASAYAAAVSAGGSQTVFVQPGSYTENLTGSPNVNICAFDCDALTPNVVIIGKISFSSSGTMSISGVQLQTNSDYFIAVTGSAASIVNLKDCYLNCLNNTGISYSSSSSSSGINIIDCSGNVGTTGIAIFSSSGAGSISFKNTNINNSGGSSTASTISAGVLNVNSSYLNTPITSSGTSSVGFGNGSVINTAIQNATCLTIGGSGTNILALGTLESGSASSLSIGGTATVVEMVISSSNTNAITGSGTITYGGITFLSSSTVNTSTKNFLPLTVPQGGTGLSSPGSSGNILTSNGTNWTSAAPATSGTVTAVSVATANGFAGSSSGGATPALTLTTSQTGILVGNGTSMTGKNFSVVIQTFTSTGTYTPTTGMLYAIIECTGGSGAGGGSAATGVSTISGGGGGGSGEYARGVFSAATIGASQSVTIGAAGTAAAGAGGGNGGNTSVGSTLISANGGTGGNTSGASNNVIANGGAGGTGGTGGSFRVPGVAGGAFYATTLNFYMISGIGGSSIYGAGGQALNSTISNQAVQNGNAGGGYGGGGSGSLTSENNAGTGTGGAGTKGIVVITEYVIS